MPRKKYKVEILQSFGEFAALRRVWEDHTPGDPYLVLTLSLATGMPGNRDIKTQSKLKDMRLSAIKAAINEATDKFEKKHFSQEELEVLLDYLFAELNRRLNK